MSVLFLLAFLQSGPAEQVLTRQASFAAQNQAFTASFSAQHLGAPPAKGSLVADMPRQMKYEVNWGAEKYELSVTPQGVKEVSHYSKLYDEHEYFGGANYPDSKISGAGVLIPQFLLVPKLQNMLPDSSARFELQGKETVNTVEGDVLHSDFTGPMGAKGLVRAVVAPTGQVLKFRMMNETQMGKFDVTWTIDSFKKLQQPNSPMFALAFPNGYSPRSVPNLGYTLQPGDPLPTGEWTNTSGATKSLASFIGDKPVLIAVLGADCTPSKQVLPVLMGLSKKLDVLLLSDAQNAQTAASIHKDALFDSSGKNLRALHLMGTPQIFLVSSQIVVLKPWLGFDHERPEQFMGELEEALKEAQEAEEDQGG